MYTKQNNEVRVIKLGDSNNMVLLIELGFNYSLKVFPAYRTSN